MLENLCIVCGATLKEGRKKKYIKCHVCQQNACFRCSKQVFCLPDYESFSPEQKGSLKKLNVYTILFGIWVLLLFVALTFAFYLYLLAE